MATSTIPVGIDLGTTFSAIAFLDNEGRPNTITNSEGELTTPSVVFFDRDSVIVGSEAAFAGESEVTRLARAAKRDMGGVRYRNKILGRHLPPEVIQSFVLQKLKNDAALKLGEFTKAVITVPAYFNEPRRKATQDAGELAGLEVIDIINEPTAAALAYGVQRGFLNEKGEARQRELILVYDLGGGTFDVTLMEIVDSQFNALATAGDVYLGGMDWDERLFEYAKEQISSDHEVDFDSDPVLQEKLMNQCVRAKKSLTARTETVIRVESDGERYTVPIDRKQFCELTRDLLERTKLTMERLLREAKLSWKDLTNLLLVGGSTRMPMVLEMLEQESGLKVDRSLSPDEAVAHGAAIYAGILLKHGASAGSGISITNVNSHDLGVLGIDPQTREPRRKIVIPRNHRLPVRAAKKFQTSKEGQQKIVVQIVEGGTDEGQGATTIGKCVVTDLPANIKKGTEVVVGFNYLSSGRLEVRAEIPSLKLSAQSAIDRASGMTNQEMDQWKKKLAQGVAFLESEPVVSKPVEMKSNSAVIPKIDVSSQLQTKTPTNEPAIKSSTPVKKQSDRSKKPAPKVSKQPVKPTSGSPKIRKPGPPNENQISASAAKVNPAPATSKSPRIKNPVSDFKVDEHSGIFAFGDEVLKSEIGASAVDIFRENQEAPDRSAIGESALDFLSESAGGDRKAGPGESVLDFLSQATEQKPDASDSALDDFLADLDD